MRLSIEDKLLQFTSFLANMRKDLRLGGLVGIYLLFKNSPHQIGDEIKKVIVEELLNTLQETSSSEGQQEAVYLQCALEIVGVIGPNERTLERIGVIKGLMCDPGQRRLQMSCFCTLMSLGFDGFLSLLDLAQRDFNSLQTFIL